MFKRFRQRRRDEVTRRKYRETVLCRSDFIWPVFLADGKNIVEEIPSMPDVYRYSTDKLIPKLKKLVGLGLESVLFFGVTKKKGIAQSYSPKGIVQSAIPIIKDTFPKLEVITDVCLCSYTKDGHCHIGDNDKTCELLTKIALSHAKAGADIIAPSDMMDGRVYYIKKTLAENGFSKVKILSYSAKYASNFYGPFRDAASCAPKTGDRKAYQMDFCNSKEAMEEIDADIKEGADEVMIKPAMAYLDIISKAKAKFKVPIVAYNVSGEYVMLKNTVKNSTFKPEIIEEALISIKRAGADRIVTYFVPYILGKLLK